MPKLGPTLMIILEMMIIKTTLGETCKCLESISGCHHDNFKHHVFDNYENIP